MALAIHEGGPADGLNVQTDTVTQTRYYLPAAQRSARGWLTLARYVFVPPRDGKRCQYRWSGSEQRQGPVLGVDTTPDWSA